MSLCVSIATSVACAVGFGAFYVEISLSSIEGINPIVVIYIVHLRKPFHVIQLKLMSVHTSGKFGDCLKKKKIIIMMTRKSRKSEFSRWELRARRKSWGICIARYWPLDYC